MKDPRDDVGENEGKGRWREKGEETVKREVGEMMDRGGRERGAT